MATARAQVSVFERSITPEFGVVAGFFRHLSVEIVDDVAQSSASSTAGSRAGQISLVQYKPLTQKQKIAFILKKIENGELLLAKGKSAADIAAELSKSEYADKSTKEMIAMLKHNSQFLLDDPKLKHPAPSFANAFKMKALVPALA